MKIGNLTFDLPVFLAPMAGVTDRSFRLLAREQGCPLCFGEMVSAKAVCFQNAKTLDMLRTTPNDRPFALQLFGSEPKTIAQAAKFIEATGYADIIDFNMGCPVPKIINNGEGSALMKKPRLAGAILAELCHAVNLPVTVKIRKGFDDEHINAVEIAHIAEDAGAAAIAVHGRTREQYYDGTADWNIIAAVKQAVKIPVIGNGDIKTSQDAAAMFARTNCDGVMIGRAARGNPWIFADIAALLRGQVSPPPITDIDRANYLLRHLEMLVADKGEYTALREMRKHAAWYTKGLSGSAKLREHINRAESIAEFKAIINTAFKGCKF